MLNELYQRACKTLRRSSLALAGRWHYVLGDRASHADRARDDFSRLLELDPASFSARLYLGRIAARAGRPEQALREFVICYRLDKRRFRRAHIPTDLKNTVLWRERLADVLGLDWSPSKDRRERQTVGGRTTGVRHVAGGLAVQPDAGIPTSTDFSSVEEYLRIRDLPPITTEDIVETDWDEVLTRLLEES